jgi:DNA-binding SARP family transcriptional activator
VTPSTAPSEDADPHRLRAVDGKLGGTSTLARLLAAVEIQQARLDTQLALVLRAFADDGPPDQPRSTPPQRAATAHALAAQSGGGTVVRCLGSLQVTVGGIAVDGWRSGKARALFEYLVTHRNRAVTRETLIQALWPDPDALAAGTSLKVAVHALRQVLAESARNGASATLTVVGRDSGYELKAPSAWVDVEEFERCCRLAGQLDRTGAASEALELYERAADLYRGDFLADAWDDWVVFRREGLKDQYLFVLARLADAAIDAGDYQRCIEFCQRLLEEDMCREDTFRTLMVCHARLGQRGRVRRWYDLCVRTLRTTLDIEPEPETQRVYEWAAGIASNQPLPTLARPRGRP